MNMPAEIQDHANTGSAYQRHADLLLNFSQSYGALDAIRTVVLHLFNSANKVNLAAALRNCDAAHKAVLFDLLHGYALHGERDREFMHVGLALFEAKRAREWRP